MGETEDREKKRQVYLDEILALRRLLDDAADVLESYGRNEWHETNLAENMALKIRDTLNANSAG